MLHLYCTTLVSEDMMQATVRLGAFVNVCPVDEDASILDPRLHFFERDKARRLDDALLAVHFPARGRT